MKKLPHGVRQRIAKLIEDGLTASEIARKESVCYNTVRNYMANAEKLKSSKGPGRVSLFIHSDVAKIIEQFIWSESNYDVALSIICKNPEKYGLPPNFLCSLRTFRRFIQGHLTNAPTRNENRIIRPFFTSAGDQVQIDFGQDKFPINGLDTDVNFLVVVYAFSRRGFVYITTDQKGPSWMCGLASILGTNGVPTKVLCDNASSLVARREGDQVVFKEGFKSFCEQLGLDQYACKPYRPQTKGRAERFVGYVKDSGFAYAKNEIGSECKSLAELQERLNKWIIEKSDKRYWNASACSGPTVKEVFDKYEAPSLHFLTEEQRTNLVVWTDTLSVSPKGEVTFYGYTVHVNNEKRKYTYVQVAVFGSANYIILSMNHEFICKGQFPRENLHNFPFVNNKEALIDKSEDKPKKPSRKRKSKAPLCIGTTYSDAGERVQSNASVEVSNASLEESKAVSADASSEISPSLAISDGDFLDSL